MKFALLTILALLGFATTAQVPDSATQGPNPQDIATPEPEYIDIDLPEPASAPAAAPRPIARSIASAPAPAPLSLHSASLLQRQQYLPPLAQSALLPGHSFSTQNGYQYRRPVYIRRIYRHRRY